MYRAERQRRHPAATDLTAVPDELRAVCARQEGVLVRGQLLAAGFTPRAIDAAIAGRRWRAFGRHVVVPDNAPLTERQRRWVGVLLPEKPVALAGPTSASIDGLRGFESERVHVLVAHGTHTSFPSWVKVHESRRFRPTDIRRLGPPRTSVARAVVDTATWSPGPRRACAVLCASVQQRLTSADRLDQELGVAGPVRHAAIMRAILGDIGGGGHTLAEIDLGPIARRAGLGEPRRQVLRREPTGKVRYVDEFDLPDGTRLVIEIDGAVHLQPGSYWDDLDRQNELVIDRSTVLRFASLTVRLDGGRVCDQLRRVRVAHSER